jgi:photosystem II stability/assembly factor-like uncharacterized protein
MSATTCLAAGVSPDPTGPEVGELAVSTDGGNTWSSASLPPATYGLGSVTCPTTTLCIAVGAEILVSADGGQTWQIRTVVGGTEALRSISCSSASQCVAIGPNPGGVQNADAAATAVITTDGGETWQQESLPAGTAALEQLSCATTTCFAGGPTTTPKGQATFVTSTDGGSTWATASAPSAMSDVADLACPAAHNCVAVGSDSGRSVTASTADGTAWSETPVPGSVTGNTASPSSQQGGSNT